MTTEKICPKCGKPYERKSRTAAGYDCYEHKSHNEGGFRVTSSRDCCYIKQNKTNRKGGETA